MKKQMCCWCGTETTLLPDKRYCEECAKRCICECVRCHRPFDDMKYFLYSKTRCNSCFKTYEKEAKKRKLKKRINQNSTVNELEKTTSAPAAGNQTTTKKSQKDVVYSRESEDDEEYGYDDEDYDADTEASPSSPTEGDEDEDDVQIVDELEDEDEQLDEHVSQTTPKNKSLAAKIKSMPLKPTPQQRKRKPKTTVTDTKAKRQKREAEEKLRENMLKHIFDYGRLNPKKKSGGNVKVEILL